jgi:outer membrane protein OmpA-like peptidoglycan-associated protein
MPTNAFSVKAAGKASGAALLSLGLMVLSACGGMQERATNAAASSWPTRVADAPKPPAVAQSLDEAVVSMTVALLDRAQIAPPEDRGGYKLVVDPLIDRATGEQSVTTRSMEQRIGSVLRQRYPDIHVQPFNTASLAEKPLILLGAITPVAGAGVVPPTSEPRPQTYRIWAVLGDLRTGKVVSHETAWVRAGDVETMPTGFFRDSPTWTADAITTAYLKTCAANAGDPIDPAYLKALEAQALVADGTKAYEQGDFTSALNAYQLAASRDGGDQLRVRNGLYLSNRALDRPQAAEAAFGDVVDYGLDHGRLAVKFLFSPGTTRFWSGQGVSDDYPMWLRQIAQRTAPRAVCLTMTGHASPTGPTGVNQRLSASRAETVRSRLVAVRSTLRPRTRADGLGEANPLIGTGKDDATDALDRRVEFTPEACPMQAGHRL